MTRAQRYAEDIEVGTELPPLRETFTPRRLVMFAGAALDFYEIHYDRAVAEAQGHEDLLVHGALKNALLGRFLHEWVAPDGRVISYGCSYRGIDRPGEELVCRGTVAGTRPDGDRTRVEVDIRVEKADGTVTTPGHGVVMLPSRP